MDNSVYVDMQDYITFSENYSRPLTINTTEVLTVIPDNELNKGEYKWTENNSKLLIDMYSKYRKKVGSFQMRTLKKLWEKIAEELQKLNVHVTPNNCLNRWRVLERNYKKFVDNKNKTGRGRKYFEYETEMEAIFGQKKNIFPEILLTLNTRDDLLEHEEINIEINCREEKNNIEETPQARLTKSRIIRKRSTTIENIRLDRKAYYDKRLEIERRKLGEMERRNKLIEERNNIIKEHNCFCQCNN